MRTVRPNLDPDLQGWIRAHIDAIAEAEEERHAAEREARAAADRRATERLNSQLERWECPYRSDGPEWDLGPIAISHDSYNNPHSEAYRSLHVSRKGAASDSIINSAQELALLLYEVSTGNAAPTSNAENNASHH